MSDLYWRKAKLVFSHVAPGAFNALRAAKMRMFHRKNEQIAAQLLPYAAGFVEARNWRIAHGPFQGLQYHTSAAADIDLPRMVGSYEAEIHAFIEDAVARKPKAIIDIGCENGLVAVGLAMRCEEATVYAFDILQACRDRTRELAVKNGVADRIKISGECTHAELDALVQKDSLVFCDCEGAELVLLDPGKAPNLKRASVLVEFHDFLRKDMDISQEIVSRFRATHDIRLVERQERYVESYPALAALPEHIRPLAIYEDRMPRQGWGYFTPKADT